MPRNSSNVKKGLTFVEVLAAVMILSVALVPIMNWLPVSMQARTKAERKTSAIFYAQYGMELMRANIIRNFVFGGQITVFILKEKYTVSMSSRINGDLATVTAKAWYTNSPQDVVTLYTQIARR